MNNQDKTKEELIKELQELKQVYDALKVSHEADIKMRRKAEGENRILADIVIKSADFIGVADPEGKAFFINPAGKALLGLDEGKEGIQTVIEDYFFPEDLHIVKQEIIPTVMEKGRWSGEFRFRHFKTGEPVYVYYDLFLTLDPSTGKVQNFSTISRNITEFKRAMEVVAKKKYIMNQAEELAKLGSWEWDIKNDKWIMSENWKKIHGVADIQLTTNQLLPIAHPEDRPAIFEAFKRAAENGEPYDIQHRIIRQDTGEIRYVNARGLSVFDPNGKPEALIGAVQDITDRKQAEKALRQSEEKLRELNAQKDKFFSIIAHDLRSPFNAIMGISELLIERVEEKDYEGIDEYAKIIGQSSQKALDLLVNLLDWARAHTGRMEFSPANFELVDLIEENIMLFDVIAGQKAITINKTLLPGLMVFADKQMISTVLRNLISNAIKFTGQDGKISLSAEKRENEILVSVSDNGIGIARDRIERLFRIDYSESTHGTNNEKGTGLGLILCKEFVEKHGGKIWAESEKDKGSTFHFTLSCAIETTK